MTTVGAWLLFLIGLLNNNKTSESIFHNQLLQHQIHSKLTANPQFLLNPTPLTNQVHFPVYSKLLTTPLYYHPTHPFQMASYLQDPRMNYGHASISSSSWMYQLPFPVGQSCDQSLLYDPEFHRCRANSAVYWRVNEPGTSSGSSKNTCCFLWSMLDCMEDAVHRRCDFAWDVFRVKRIDYISRIQSNPICYNNYPYGSWSCLQESWWLLIAFLILGLFILATICSAFWVLFCRKYCRKKNFSTSPQNDTGGLVMNYPTRAGMSDYDVERQHEPIQVRETRSVPRRSTLRTSRTASPAALRFGKHIQLQDENNNNNWTPSTRVNSLETEEDYEQTRHWRQPYQLRQQVPVGTNRSTTKRQRSPEPPRPSSVVSARQIEI